MKMKPNRHRLLPSTGLLLILSLTNCTLHPVQEAPLPPLSVPAAFSPTKNTSTAPDKWWQAFNDSALDRLIAATLTGNLDLQGAWARLEQTRAIAAKSGAGNWPTVTLDGAVSRGKRVINLGTPVASTANQFSLSLGAAYEIDLWGRVAAQEKSALLELSATRDDLEAMAMSLAGQVAETWFTIREERSRLALLKDQIATNRTFLKLVELRFSLGQASAVDVYQQRQQLAATQAEEPPSQSRLQVLTHQLAILLGQNPSTFKPPTTTDLPDLPPLPTPGLPATLLTRRPDIRAARLRVTAADHTLAAAIADRLPAIRLSGSSGYQSTEIKDLFDDLIWNLAGGLTAPLFDGNRRQAEVDRTRAAKRQNLTRYGQVFLLAVKEVEDALVQEDRQKAFLAATDKQMAIAKETLRESRSRFGNGLSDYLPVLNALQTVQRLERNRLTASRQLLSFRVQLHRGLGGSWTENLNNNKPIISTKEEK